MRRFLIVSIIMLFAVPALAGDFDRFLGNWHGHGNGTFGKIAGFKDVFMDEEVVVAEMFLSNGELDYHSRLTCFDAECEYSDSLGKERVYSVTKRHGTLVFFWSEDGNREVIKWTRHHHGRNFVEMYRGFHDGEFEGYNCKYKLF
ncbi:hypothetical protein ACFLRA_01240 [Bdellovibrionota bacterium]